MSKHKPTIHSSSSISLYHPMSLADRPSRIHTSIPSHPNHKTSEPNPQALSQRHSPDLTTRPPLLEPYHSTTSPLIPLLQTALSDRTTCPDPAIPQGHPSSHPGPYPMGQHHLTAQAQISNPATSPSSIPSPLSSIHKTHPPQQ